MRSMQVEFDKAATKLEFREFDIDSDVENIDRDNAQILALCQIHEISSG